MNALCVLKRDKAVMNKRSRSFNEKNVGAVSKKSRLSPSLLDLSPLIALIVTFIPPEYYFNCLLNKKWRAIVTPYIARIKEQLYWRISIEYRPLEIGLDICAVWIKIGYFKDTHIETRDVAPHREDRAVVYQGRGQDLGSKILKEYPTCQIAIDTRFDLPRPVDILPYEGKNNALFIHYHTVDIEEGQFSPRLPNIYSEFDFYRKYPQQIDDAILYKRIVAPTMDDL